ncbi:sulfatase [Carboxylicivirga sp. M1479]|uniref:sulfatase n=1 Tax=Carboxylicivirga sp. M1479 TaxID=2594476 RepID=UPI001178A12B|nr:sulfatase [Carboxylicivirga sp. M1479]TRX71782.1 sulfatase [Carboxylicivirga sp. M1479]
MKRNIFLALVITLGLLSCTNSTKSKQAKKPNVLFFLVDDLGWMDVGYNGSPFYETPNIDQLANEGVRFNNAYATHPRCVPSRYSLITGRYPARAQMPGPGEGKLNPTKGVYPGDEARLEADEVTIADAMRAGGYTTFFAGKWHLAFSGTMPEHVGFDINVAGGHAGSPISFFAPYNESHRSTKKKPIEGLDDAPDGEYLTDRITDETIQFLNNHQATHPEKPFFAYVSHYAVHEPIEAKQEHVDKFEAKKKSMTYTGEPFIEEGTGTTKMHQDNATYAGMVYSMDESLGRISAKLAELGQLDNTIIVFFSDNGGLSNRGFNPRRVATSNYPLRAGKGHLYEGGVREPLIVKWPGIVKKGMQSNALVTGNDFFPTILEMVGLEPLPLAHLDGESVVWALKEQQNPNPERAVFWHSPVDRPHATGDSNSTAIRKGPYKLIEFYDQDVVELYNIEEDIEEKHDLSEQLPEIKKALLEELHQWRLDVNAYIKK